MDIKKLFWALDAFKKIFFTLLLMSPSCLDLAILNGIAFIHSCGLGFAFFCIKLFTSTDRCGYLFIC